MQPELKASGSSSPPPAGADGEGRWPDSFKKRGYVYETHPGVGDVPERVEVFKNGGPANKPIFEDRGDTLRAIDTSPETIKAMSDLALHRGWDRISITGGDTAFQRASWLELNARGIETTGYKPNERDLQEVARRIVPSGPLWEAGMPSPDPVRGVGEPGGAGGTGLGNPSASKLPPGAGELLEHGAAPYKFDQDNSDSYFARLRMVDGSERTLWGLGIADAITASSAEMGDVIRLSVTEKEPVEVQAPVRDEVGNVVGRRTIGTARNAWEVEVISKVEHGLPEQGGIAVAKAGEGMTAPTPAVADALAEFGIPVAGPVVEGAGTMPVEVSSALAEFGLTGTAGKLDGLLLAGPSVATEAIAPVLPGPSVGDAEDVAAIGGLPAGDVGSDRAELAAILTANDTARADLHPDLAAAFAQVARLDLILEEGHVDEGERLRVVQALRGELVNDLTAGVPVDRPVLRDLGNRADASDLAQNVVGVFERSALLSKEIAALESIHHFQDVAVADVDRAESPNAIPGVDIDRSAVPTRKPGDGSMAQPAPALKIER